MKINKWKVFQVIQFVLFLAVSIFLFVRKVVIFICFFFANKYFHYSKPKMERNNFYSTYSYPAIYHYICSKEHRGAQFPILS